MSPLPDSYPSPVHLPFNATALAGRFVLLPPDRVPAGPGVWLLLRGQELVVTAAGTGLPPAAAPPLGDAVTALGIGTWEGQPCRVLALPVELPLPETLRSEALLTAEPQLDIALLSLGALAAQLWRWHREARHCPRCGSRCDYLPGEWGRRCNNPDCKALHYPATHPCVIVLVRRPGEVLLTRKAGWPAGRYGLVAGFLDPGECLEEAVAREVLEETGVRVENIRYVGSQAWPFPNQLMAGFVADYRDGDVQVEERELEDARWFSLDALPNLPPKRSIARYLLDHYLAVAS